MVAQINGPASVKDRPTRSTTTKSGKATVTDKTGGGGKNPLTSALRSFGISYPNAPKPSASLLAFVRGLGMNLGTAEDQKRIGVQQVKARSQDARADLRRTSERQKENVTADLLRRGIFSSGEGNTRYARQAEDVAAKQADIARGRTEGITSIENAYQSLAGGYRTQALEKVMGEEQRQDTNKAVSAAQKASWERADAQAAKSYEESKAAQEAAFKQQEDFYRKMGLVP